jgi:hypothetical protein
VIQAGIGRLAHGRRKNQPCDSRVAVFSVFLGVFWHSCPAAGTPGNATTCASERDFRLTENTTNIPEVARRSPLLDHSFSSRRHTTWQHEGMANAGESQRCQTCYGEGNFPTDAGLIDCPDCGGSGTLPSPSTLVEWRLREIERAFGAGQDEEPQAVRWLATELRRAREALTEILALSEELPDVQERTRLRFVANGALELYGVVAAHADGKAAK